MHVFPYTDIPAKEMDAAEAPGVSMHVVIGPMHGAPNFTMRVFTVKPGGNTTHHSHAHEHEVFFHSGTGEVFLDGEIRPVTAGHVFFIPPHADHFIRNTGNDPLIFICVIPNL